jgi:hypothetical protein
MQPEANSGYLRPESHLARMRTAIRSLACGEPEDRVTCIEIGYEMCSELIVRLN